MLLAGTKYRGEFEDPRSQRSSADGPRFWGCRDLRIGFRFASKGIGRVALELWASFPDLQLPALYPRFLFIDILWKVLSVREDSVHCVKQGSALQDPIAGKLHYLSAKLWQCGRSTGPAEGVGFARLRHFLRPKVERPGKSTVIKQPLSSSSAYSSIRRSRTDIR